MMTTPRFLSLGAALLLLGACAACDLPTIIILEIDSDYAIPAEVDLLEIVVSDPDTDEEIQSLSLNLHTLPEGSAFPITVSLEPRVEETPKWLKTLVLGSLNGEQRGSVAIIHDWRPQKISKVRIEDL